MAIRYSADTEVRVVWDQRQREFHGTVRDPYLRWKGSVKGPKGMPRTISSEEYDRAAGELLRAAQIWARSKRTSFQLKEELGRIKLTREFKAPCPVRRPTPRGRGRPHG